jgi:hypothetical protein
MIVPVIVFDLCTGLSVDDPAKQVHAPFRDEEAALKWKRDLEAGNRAGQILLAGKVVFVVPRSMRMEASSFEDAARQGYKIDYDALAAAWSAKLQRDEEEAEPVGEVEPVRLP